MAVGIASFLSQSCELAGWGNGIFGVSHNVAKDPTSPRGIPGWTFCPFETVFQFSDFLDEVTTAANAHGADA